MGKKVKGSNKNVYEELGQEFDQYHKCHMKILLR
jgi:hypothetical protein